MIIDNDIIRELAQCAQNLLDMEEEAGIGPYLENPEHEDGHEYIGLFWRIIHSNHRETKERGDKLEGKLQLSKKEISITE